ncbi:penicillin acylase family protein [Brevibacillus dissolubilis]|uniref:penicillin acylase family protein n=1 Tax=Brevibacillus dissolubilis TaxID=1844116 RepID=UPI001116944A|nr:penicillin acylase family protein [Brevibacillus dissolubilis]
MSDVSNASQPVTPVPTAKPVKKRRWLLYSLLGLGIVVGGTFVSVYMYAAKSLPITSGQLIIPGLDYPVTVYRDKRGVPHIEAQTSQDLYVAQGYVTAQDRLWQMDLSRRAVAGRLSEVMGESQVATDTFFRTLQLYRMGEKSVEVSSHDTSVALMAYAEGVNTYIAEAIGENKLPPEFSLLGYQPEAWKPADTVAIYKLMAYQLNRTWASEVFLYQLRQKVGDELARQLLPVYPVGAVTIIPDDETPSNKMPNRELPPSGTGVNLDSLMQAAVFPDESLGSNNWVVSGTKTASGKPLLANDPHLGISAPSIWYQSHLIVNGPEEKLNVIGVTFPGSPGIMIGHNEQIAWGVTNVNPDVQDLYIEKRNPDNPQQFEYNGKWLDAKVFQEEIKVKDKPSIPLEVVVTHHGPIVSEVTGAEGDRPQEALALKWTVYNPSNELDTFLRINQASNWQEFREALKDYHLPAQNFVYAGTDGVIAYHATGDVPIRAKGDGLLPVPGWTDEYEWTSMIPFDEMPELINPQSGFIATANNKIIGDPYPYHITHSWSEPHRAARIVEVLSQKEKLTADDMRRLQADYVNKQAEEVLPLIIPSIQPEQLNETQKAALTMLGSWDQVDSAEQAAPLLFHLWWKHLMATLYTEQMGDALYKRMTDQHNVTFVMLKHAADGQENDWIKGAGGLTRLVTTSFQKAVNEAVTLQGNDPSKWQWGSYHQFGPQHTIGKAVKPLGWLLNTKAVPVGGSRITVGAMVYSQDNGLVNSSAPWRQVVDLAQIATNSMDVNTPGQSGHFLSPWYADQQMMMINGDMQPQLFTPEQYRTGEILMLQPK